MPHQFVDHPRKRVVRERWDTPLLRCLHDRWQRQYFYVGLPGPAAMDVELWRDMIARVIAFEIEDSHAKNPRKNILALNRKLTLLNIRSSVYCGPMEEVVIWRKDYDGKELLLDEFVTLFNLDFCNSITGRIPTTSGPRRCLRFEALREIVTLQRELYRRTGAGQFVLLMTAQNAFHLKEMKRFLSNRDLPSDVTAHCAMALGSRRLSDLAESGLVTGETELLRMFVFVCLRDYFRGQNIQSWFLPPVAYMGTTQRSPMLHFTVLCSMADMEAAHVIDRQCVNDFIRSGVVLADDQRLTVLGSAAEVDPVVLLQRLL